MSKTIFSVFFPDENKPQVQLEYIPGSQNILLSSLVAAALNNQELREVFFNTVANCIALADNPQEWLESLINGVNYAIGNVKIESEGSELKSNMS